MNVKLIPLEQKHSTIIEKDSNTRYLQGFPYRISTLGMTATTEFEQPLPSYDFIFCTSTPVTDIEQVQIDNYGSAFVTLYGATVSESKLWYTMYSDFQIKKGKTIDEEQEFKIKQHKMIENWYNILPLTQLLTISDYKTQSKHYTKKWIWKFNSRMQHFITSSGPFQLFVLRCQPFFHLCRQPVEYDKTDEKVQVVQKHNQNAKQASEKTEKVLPPLKFPAASIGIQHLAIFVKG